MIIKMLRYVALTVMTLAAVACTDYAAPEKPANSSTPGREVLVDLTISAEPVYPGMEGTRALPGDIEEGTTADYKVKDFWVLEYDNAGNLIGSPKYYEESDLQDGTTVAIPVILPPDDGTEYRCVVIANTHTPNFSEIIGEAGTINSLKKYGKSVAKQSDLYNSSHDLIMNGVVAIGHNTSSLDCRLYRNVAKLTLKLTNANGSGVKINTVQICNVPEVMIYADRLFEGEAAAVPTAEVGFNTWEPETATLEPGGEDLSFTYYLPRNCRGDNSSTLPSQKNQQVPEFATYIEIMAEETATGVPVRYRFYPGKNMVNNFDIIPNKHYTLPITVSGKGAETDSRVENMGTIELVESNSYIINPLNGGAQQLHQVPISRINKFWGSVDGTIATDDAGHQEVNTIEDGTVWEAVVIWQDADTRLIDFCDKNGNVLKDENGTPADKYTGTGNSFFYFKPTGAARGNAIVGVRKQSGVLSTFLWSWHLWITDYNPDQRTAGWNEGQYTYEVPGGKVHRYAPAEDNNLWESTLKNKYIMDRNLGAKSASANDYLNTIGFYYQFGRKDPIPHATTLLYDINGKPLKEKGSPMWTASPNDCMEIVASPAPYIYYSVKRPYVIYPYVNQDWVNHDNNEYYKSSWYNPFWYDSKTGKSLFDPCPPGWRIPANYNIWKTFLDNKGTLDTQGSTTIGWTFTLEDNTGTFYPFTDTRNNTNFSNGRYVTYQISNTYTFVLNLKNNLGIPSLGASGRGSFWSVRPVRE